MSESQKGKNGQNKSPWSAHWHDIFAMEIVRCLTWSQIPEQSPNTDRAQIISTRQIT